MNKWIDKHLRKYAVSNLSLIIILCYGFGYILQAVNASFLDYLTLNPYAIVHCQVWRLLTWVFVPPGGSSNIFFVMITMLFYYSIGTSLERTWGTWRYNKYIFGGLIFTILGSFVILALTYLMHGDLMATADAVSKMRIFALIGRSISTYYVGMSIFLAYAATFPEAEVLFMFLLPIRVKWLGIVYGVFIVIEFLQYALQGYYYMCVTILASLLNFILFWFGSRDMRRFSPKEFKRRADFKRAVSGQDRTAAGSHTGSGNASGSGPVGGSAAGARQTIRPDLRMRPAGALHKCAICGRTQADGADLEFRYCSRCEGSYEFCTDHLFTHEHAAGGKGPRPIVIEPKQ